MSTRLHGNEIALCRAGKRCTHGFMGGENCPECHPELMCCAICGIGGHEAKLCPETKIGRSRRAQLREERKRERRNVARRASRKKKRIGEDILCPSLGVPGAFQVGRGGA